MKRFFLNILVLSMILNALVLPEPEPEPDPSYFIVQGYNSVEWQEESNGLFESSNWSSAIDYCTSLELGDFGSQTGWRLPNYNELYSLVDVNRNSSMLPLLFLSDTNQTYWTSTSYKGDINNQAWVIDFSTGKDGIVEKEDDNISIRCVRDLSFSGE